MIVSLQRVVATATQSPAGSYLMAEYRQAPRETRREFAERIHLEFSRDLGMSWNQWPQSQRRSLARKFLSSVRADGPHHLSTHEDEEYLAHQGWAELLSEVSGADPERLPQQTVLTLHQQPTTPTSPPNCQPPPTPDWTPSHQTPLAHYPHPDLSNPILHPTWEHRPPRSRRRRRRRGQGNPLPPSGQRLAYVRSEMNTISQLMGKITSDLGELVESLSTMWGIQETSGYPTINHIGRQGTPGDTYPTQVEHPYEGHNECAKIIYPSQPPVGRTPGNLSPQTTVGVGAGTYWAEADYSTPGSVHYQSPANPGFHPPDWTHLTQPEISEYER